MPTLQELAGLENRLHLAKQTQLDNFYLIKNTRKTKKKKGMGLANGYKIHNIVNAEAWFKLV